MAKLPRKFTGDDVKKAFEYVPSTGRMIRRGRGLGARVGIEVGHIESNGHRRAWFGNKPVLTHDLVWAWHHGELPSLPIKHKNCDQSDDRIENLELKRNVSAERRAQLCGLIKRFNQSLGRSCVSGLYQIRNVVNGNRYIGSSTDIERRFVGHHNQLLRKGHHSLVMQRAWDKYGEDAFSFEVLMICADKDLVFYEQRFLDALKPAYNMAPSAGSMLRFKMSDETRAKLSESHKGKVSWMKGRKHTDETRARISLKRKGQKFGAYSPERIAKNLSGRKFKYTREQILAVRKLRTEKMTYVEIAAATGVNWSSVADICNGRMAASVTV